MTLGARKLDLLALACAALLPPHAAGSDRLARPVARLAQRLNRGPFPADCRGGADAAARPGAAAAAGCAFAGTTPRGRAAASVTRAQGAGRGWSGGLRLPRGG